MMAILEWTQADAPGIERAGVSRIWIEVDTAGIIRREIGLDSSGGVVYIAPARRGKLRYGLFDLQVLAPDSERRGTVSPDDFERIWARAARVFGGVTGRTVS